MGKAETASKRIASALACGALAVALSACGTGSDMSNLLVQPGKFDIYTCDQIVDRLTAVIESEHKLEGLMARASRETSGQMVSAIAYEPDYQAARGEDHELRKSAAAKNCTIPPEPGNRGSENAIR